MSKKETKFTREEEFKALVMAQLTDEIYYKNILIAQYEDLIRKTAHDAYKRTNKNKVSMDDLLSEGYIGLLKAIEKHNPIRCNNLYPTAFFYIRESINNLVMDSITSTRKLSTNSNGRKLFNGLGKTKRELGFSSPLTDKQVETLSEKLNVSANDIQFMENAKNESTTDVETILDRQSEFQENDVDNNIDEVKILKALKTKIIGMFPEREQKIIGLRILTDEPIPAAEVAKMFGITTASIYQIEKKVTAELIKQARKEFKLKNVA